MSLRRSRSKGWRPRSGDMDVERAVCINARDLGPAVMSRVSTLGRIWRALSEVGRLSTVVEPQGCSGVEDVPFGDYIGCGEGTVQLEHQDSWRMVFHEEGIWRTVGGAEHRFRNVYRWIYRRAEFASTDSVNRSAEVSNRGRLALEHLRHGSDRPVHLVEFEDAGGGQLVAAEPHACAPDTYDAGLKLAVDGLALEWRVTGPRKHYRMRTVYRPRTPGIQEPVGIAMRAPRPTGS